MADDTTIKAGGTGLRSYEDYLEAQKKGRAPKQNLGKDDFLALLVAQMQNQDPMEPTKDTEFVAQLAQFSSLEQINALTETMSMFQSYSLTGKFVYAEVKLENGQKVPVAGVVEKIVSKDGKAWAQVGDYLLDVSAIVEVIDYDYAMGTNPLLQNTGLVGKYASGKVEQIVKGEDGKETSKLAVISGYITRIAVDDQMGMVAYIEDDEGKNHKVSLSTIYDISTSKPATEIEVPKEGGEVEGGENEGTEPVEPTDPTDTDPTETEPQDTEPNP